MEKGKFVFNVEEFETAIVKEMLIISKDMDKCYKEAVKLMKNDVADYKGWQGKQKEELLAFLDLLTQYHKDLTVGKNSPTESFYNTISKFGGEVNDYVKNAKSYTTLEGVWK